METKNKAISCSVINCLDATTLVMMGLYFLYISRNWFPLFIFMSALGTLCFILVLICVPESPKWLLIKGDVAESIKSFNRIAAFNCAKKRIPADA